MKARIVWMDPVLEVFRSLPPREQDEIIARVRQLANFPYMYPVRTKGRRFRRYRWFVAGNWLVYYRVAQKTVYIRGLWPSQIP